MAALEAHHDIGALGQPIDDLALAFVAPLGADDHDIGHGLSPLKSGLKDTQTAPSDCGAVGLYSVQAVANASPCGASSGLGQGVFVSSSHAVSFRKVHGASEASSRTRRVRSIASAATRPSSRDRWRSGFFARNRQRAPIARHRPSRLWRAWHEFCPPAEGELSQLTRTSGAPGCPARNFPHSGSSVKARSAGKAPEVNDERLSFMRASQVLPAPLAKDFRRSPAGNGRSR